MIVFILIVSVIAMALILPGWLWAKRLRPQSFWLLFLPIFGIAFWFFLAVLRVGPQSLSNLIEIPMVAIIAVAAAYLKILALDTRLKKHAHGVAIAYVIVAFVTLGLRLFMPLLPE